MPESSLKRQTLTHHPDQHQSNLDTDVTWAKPLYIPPKLTSYSAERILEWIKLAQIGDGLTDIYTGQWPFGS